MQTTMFLSVGHPCKPKALFDVPHKAEPMSAKRIARKFPAFAALFDGQSAENTLSFYYKKNKMTDVYEFIDVEAEEEVAELMGVRILAEIVEDEDEKAQTLVPLTDDQLAEFKDHMQDIRVGKEWLQQN
jgi:hypothetical protein